MGRLVSIETGKIISEGLGEVQEMIDICDFAVGLSRQLYGLTIASERAEHRMMETWHPLGVTGIISAFNFPVAVWAWNAALALVCGNACVWKPSEKTPLTALATQALFDRALARFREAGNSAQDGLSTVIVGGREAGEALADHPLVPLVSATGSTAMGRAIAPRLAQRFARAILELGGNNGAIICPSADLDLTLRAVAFAAMGTAGQRCTTLRRLFVHESIYERFVPRLKQAYASVKVGNPLQLQTLIGPLIDGNAFAAMQTALEAAKAAGGAVAGGARVTQKMCLPPRSMCAPRWSRCPVTPGRSRRKLSRRSSTSCATATFQKRSGYTTPSRKGYRPRSSRTICAKPSFSCPRAGPIAASPT